MICSLATLLVTSSFTQKAKKKNIPPIPGHPLQDQLHSVHLDHVHQQQGLSGTPKSWWFGVWNFPASTDFVLGGILCVFLMDFLNMMNMTPKSPCYPCLYKFRVYKLTWKAKKNHCLTTLDGILHFWSPFPDPNFGERNLTSSQKKTSGSSGCRTTSSTKGHIAHITSYTITMP